MHDPKKDLEGKSELFLDRVPPAYGNPMGAASCWPNLVTISFMYFFWWIIVVPASRFRSTDIPSTHLIGPSSFTWKWPFRSFITCFTSARFLPAMMRSSTYTAIITAVPSWSIFMKHEVSVSNWVKPIVLRVLLNKRFQRLAACLSP